MKAAFRQPGFRLLFAGLLTSMIGDSLMLIVLAIWVKELTGSSGAAGLTFFFVAIPALIAPLFGLMIDRVRRRTLLTWGNVASAVAVMPLLLVHDEGDVWIVYLVAMLYGVSFVVLPAALNGLLKEMMPEELLVEANASLATTREALRLVGPLLGAGLYAGVGGGAVAVVDAVSFLFAAVAIASLGVREDVPEYEPGHWRTEFFAGVHHLVRDRILKHTVIALAIALLVVGFTESGVFSLVDAFGKPASFVGVVITVQGVGAIAGGLSSARLIRARGEVVALSTSLVLFSLALAVTAAAGVLWIVFAAVIVMGFALPVFIVAFTTLLQRRTPLELMGRVSTATDVVLGTPQSISIAVGALLVSALSYRGLFWIAAGVMLVSAAYLMVVLGTGESATSSSDDAELGEDLAEIESSGLD